MRTIVMRFCLIFVIILCSPFILCGQKEDRLLQAGPMVGTGQMREVKLWVQTTSSARVKIVYYETTNASLRYTTDEIITRKESAFTAHLIADNVEPGRKYKYELYINNKKVQRPYPLEFQTPKLWLWRTDPPNFKVAVGSCAYMNEPQYDRPGRPYGGSQQIYKTIHAQRPDIMLWLGDNVYTRESDWNSRTGILKRYTHSRSIVELQPLLGSIHHYATWDDHDFGPNDADRSFVHKNLTLEVFKLFWANPTYGVMDRPGVTTQFEWGDVEFFLLDNRYYRSPNNRKTTPREYLSEWQLQWLIDALSSSKATFKIIAVGGQVLNPVTIYENYSMYPEERQKLLDLIEKENIKGVIFLSGDRHHTELSKLERNGTYPLYDFTISPLTAGTNPSASTELNTLRVPGTFIGEQNFAIFEFTGASKERMLKCTILNQEGKELWTQSINAKDIR